MHITTDHKCCAPAQRTQRVSRIHRQPCVPLVAEAQAAARSCPATHHPFMFRTRPHLYMSCPIHSSTCTTRVTPLLRPPLLATRWLRAVRPHVVVSRQATIASTCSVVSTTTERRPASSSRLSSDSINSSCDSMSSSRCGFPSAKGTIAPAPGSGRRGPDASAKARHALSPLAPSCRRGVLPLIRDRPRPVDATGGDPTAARAGPTSLLNWAQNIRRGVAYAPHTAARYL